MAHKWCFCGTQNTVKVISLRVGRCCCFKFGCDFFYLFIFFAPAELCIKILSPLVIANEMLELVFVFMSLNTLVFCFWQQNRRRICRTAPSTHTHSNAANILGVLCFNFSHNVCNCDEPNTTALVKHKPKAKSGIKKTLQRKHKHKLLPAV